MRLHLRVNIREEWFVVSKAFLNSYAQVFFSDKPLFAWLLIAVTFLDYVAGLSGLFAVLVTVALSYLIGLDKHKIAKGLYGFNSLLVGLALGVYFVPGWTYYFVLLLAMILTLFICVSLEGIIGKYALPYLSLPFILSVWLVALATRQFDALGISERGIYTLNRLYFIGGSFFVNLYDQINSFHIPGIFRTYFLSLGAIFFQFNVLSGIIIALGLLIYSRITFSLSLIGFSSAYLFYILIGANFTDLNYSYIGFNYILTAIAIGGFFIIPSLSSYLWTVVLIPLVAVITISLDLIFRNFGLSIYALPFNITVLLFLYTLKFRTNYRGRLNTVYLQQNSPEKNLYSYQNTMFRSGGFVQIPVNLPFWGTWTVSQACDGEYTHQGQWKHAWDFIISNKQGQQYRNQGNLLDDYYCYAKDVLAPADGIIEEIIDGIDENKVGEINTINNWGNTIVIRHTEYLYSKLCHLKRDTIKVRKAERVRSGDVIAKVGNSGRSPYPHLHFQFQETPYIGSQTISYPFSYYIRHEKEKFSFATYSFPVLNEHVSNIHVNDLLVNAFHLVPGKSLKFRVKHNGKTYTSEWTININPYNQSYIWCKNSRSAAYFYNDGQMLVFTHFDGNRHSVLYYFYLSAFRIPLGFYKNLEVTDLYPLHQLCSSITLFLHDFIAPFISLLKASYSLKYVSMDDPMAPTKITLSSEASHWLLGSKLKTYHFSLEINPQGLYMLHGIIGKNEEIEAICVD